MCIINIEVNILKVKDNIQEILLQKKGEFISGSEIAKQLSVSRNAVWKAIKELEAIGYEIESVKNKGYRLVNEVDFLSVDEIKNLLKDKPIDIILKEETGSTNEDAKATFLNSENQYALVLSNSQKKGKGRNGKSFFSPKSGIYMSLCFAPKLKAYDATYLTSAAGVAVCEALKAVCKIQPKIKWVNDIYLNEKKLCGILTEASTDFESGNLQYVVIGIGINYRFSSKQLPDEIKEIATSLFEHCEQTLPTRNVIISMIVHQLIDLIENETAQNIINRYRELSMVVGRKLFVIKGENVVEAVGVSIDKNGGLVVRYSDGTGETLTYGEVSLKL